MYNAKTRNFFIAIAVSCLSVACQLPRQVTGMQAPFGSLAQIDAISPDPIEVLRPGQQVNLKVDVNYVLTATSGTIRLLVLAEDNSSVATASREITKGSGKTTLEARFTVPQTRNIRVFTPLLVAGLSSASPSDGRQFRVLAE